MTQHLFDRPLSRRTVLGTLAAAGLSACGGGGDGIDSGGTGGAPSSFSHGSIAGFGSIIVNGVRFDDSHAAIVDDAGTPHARADLKLGMVVDIEAGPIDGDNTGERPRGVARRIEFASEIRGPLQSLDVAAGRFTALGQTVHVDADTVFEALPDGLASLHVGQLVEVYGFIDLSSGSYTATRIERHAAMPAYKLRGPVAGLDTGARRFTIGALVIRYDDVQDPSLDALADGMLLRIELQATPQRGEWAVRTARVRERRIDEGVDATLEGFVRELSAAGTFRLNGITVDVSDPALRFRRGDRSLIVEGARITVEGQIDGGVLRARRVHVRRAGGGDEDFELEGRIQAHDRQAASFELQGITVTVDARTRFVGGQEADLAVGRRVEVRGVLAGPGERLLATRIKFDR